MSGWFALNPDGALITLRVVPNAGRDGIEGVVTLGDERTALKLRIAAQPENGRANAAAIALLAKATGLPKSAFSVRSGATARTKTILLAADPALAKAALEALEAAASGN